MDTGFESRAAPLKGIECSLTLVVPLGWQVDTKRIDITPDTLDNERTLTFNVLIPPKTPPGTYSLSYMIRCGGHDYNVLLEPVHMAAPGLPGLPNETNCIQEEFMTPPAEMKIHLI